MQLSLCALLPVYNAQDIVQSLAVEYLETAAELTTDFQVLVIDDGSLDATTETAVELETRYPQLHVISHPARLGERAVWESAVREGECDVFFCRGEETRLDSLSLATMWPFIAMHDVVLGRGRISSPLGWIPKLPTRRADASASAAGGWSSDGCLLVRRELIDGWLASGRPGGLARYMAGAADSCHTIELRATSASPWRGRTALAGQGGNQRTPASGHRSRAVTKGNAEVRRQADDAPRDQLSKLRDFALGE